MRRDISDYLQDILDNINIATAFLNGMNFVNFEADQRTAYAVVRAIEIVGEAAKSIPIETRQQYPEMGASRLCNLPLIPQPLLPKKGEGETDSKSLSRLGRGI